MPRKINQTYWHVLLNRKAREERKINQGEKVANIEVFKHGNKNLQNKNDIGILFRIFYNKAKN